MNCKIVMIYLLLSIFIMGCSNDEKIIIIDCDDYNISIPHDWKLIKGKGTDSDVNIIITSKGDSIFSDYGRYSEKFHETIKVFSTEQINKYKSMGMDTKELFYSVTPEIDQAQGTFLKEYYYYKAIDSHLAKIKVPKINHDGNIGISFEQIDKSNNRLTIQGKVIDGEEQKLLLKSFETIVFKKTNTR